MSWNFVIVFGMVPVVVSALADGDTMFVEIRDCLWPSTSGVDWGQLSSTPATDNALEHGLSPVMGPVIDWEEVGLGG